MDYPTKVNSQVQLDGVARCARYAFGPNRLHLCGPDLNSEVMAYINAGASDEGLSNILQGFNTLFPYLQQIALNNHIRDPFDPRVVEAYWLGNSLLDTIPAKAYWQHLKENIRIKKTTPVHQIDQLKDKLSQGALMHHSFHVFNIWRRTGHDQSEHNLSSLDQCRISCGLIKQVDGPTLIVARQPLILQAGKLTLGPPETIKLYRRLENSSIMDNVQAGDLVSIHWNIPCEVITPKQRNNLIKYTNWSLKLANQTI